MNTNRRKLVEKQLRIAVDLQIELWEAVERIREMADRDCDPLVWIQANSITADSGMELGQAEIDDFLLLCR